MSTAETLIHLNCEAIKLSPLTKSCNSLQPACNPEAVIFYGTKFTHVIKNRISLNVGKCLKGDEFQRRDTDTRRFF